MSQVVISNFSLGFLSDKKSKSFSCNFIERDIEKFHIHTNLVRSWSIFSYTLDTAYYPIWLMILFTIYEENNFHCLNTSSIDCLFQTSDFVLRVKRLGRLINHTKGLNAIDEVAIEQFFDMLSKASCRFEMLNSDIVSCPFLSHFRYCVRSKVLNFKVESYSFLVLRPFIQYLYSLIEKLLFSKSLSTYHLYLYFTKSRNSDYSLYLTDLQRTLNLTTQDCRKGLNRLSELGVLSFDITGRKDKAIIRILECHSIFTSSLFIT